MGAFLDGEWEAICKLCSVEDDQTDISAYMLECIPATTEQDVYSLTSTTPSCFSNAISYPSLLPIHGHVNCGLNTWISDPETPETSHGSCTENAAVGTGSVNDLPASNDISICFDFSTVSEDDIGSFAMEFLETASNDAIEGSVTPMTEANFDDNCLDLASPITVLSVIRKRGAAALQDKVQEKTSPKKKGRISRAVQKGKKKAQPESDAETNSSPPTENFEEVAYVGTRQSVGSEIFNDECNGSEEINQSEDSESNKSVLLTSTGKKRASRGAATDPQSLYARRRRMRINERLRILQSLVPNGTKVDLSTMLEEAFHYVKFLQLQIRLLSSDDFWMYAPLAYNGVDMAAYTRMSPFVGL